MLILVVGTKILEKFRVKTEVLKLKENDSDFHCFLNRRIFSFRGFLVMG